jgi:hypothetical protein
MVRRTALRLHLALPVQPYTDTDSDEDINAVDKHEYTDPFENGYKHCTCPYGDKDCHAFQHGYLHGYADNDRHGKTAVTHAYAYGYTNGHRDGYAAGLRKSNTYAVSSEPGASRKRVGHGGNRPRPRTHRSTKAQVSQKERT